MELRADLRLGGQKKGATLITYVKYFPTAVLYMLEEPRMANTRLEESKESIELAAQKVEEDNRYVQDDE